MTFEGLQLSVESATKKVRDKDFTGVIADLTHVVDNLCAEKEQRALLKMSSYNQRAQCVCELADYASVHPDTELAIQLCRTIRPSESDRKKPRKKDLLKPQFHLAYAHPSQAYEDENNALEAIFSYRRALDAILKGIAQDRLDSCFLSNGIPSVDFEDASLKP
jgi:hypothetical protein